MEPNSRPLPQQETTDHPFAKSKDDPTKLHLNSAHNFTLQELELLTQSRCRCCQGFGHDSASCPSLRKLKDFASVSSPRAEILARSRCLNEQGPA